MRVSRTFKTIAQIKTVGSYVLFIFLVVYGWSTNLVSVVPSQPEVEEVPIFFVWKQMLSKTCIHCFLNITKSFFIFSALKKSCNKAGVPFLAQGLASKLASKGTIP